MDTESKEDALKVNDKGVVDLDPNPASPMNGSEATSTDTSGSSSPSLSDEETQDVASEVNLASMSKEEREKAAEGLKEKGNNAFKEADYRAAIRFYSLALAHDNTSAVLYSNRAAAHLKIEEYGSSLADAEQAIKCDKLYIKAHYRRGASHMAMAKHKEAMDDFRQVLRLKPGDAEATKRFEMCKKAYLEQQFALAIGRDETKLPSESLDLTTMTIRDTYDGPKIDFTKPVNERYTPKLVREFMKWFEDQKTKDLPRKILYTILLDAISILKSLPSLVDVPVPEGTHITVCGDTHGQYYDVLNIFKLNGDPSEENPYLFNGDFVDRGSFSLEVILTLLLWKLALPNHMHMTRGNHESTSMNLMYGFKGEVLAKADEKTFNIFTELFKWLPIAYCLGNKVLVVHGGLFQEDGVTLDMIRKTNRFREPPEKGIMCDALWSDPSFKRGRNPPHRGCGTLFGPDVTEKFLEDNNLKLLVRSHEVKQEGYSVEHNGKCITVFSAPNYVDQMKNKGAYLVFDSDLNYTVQQFTAVPHPPVAAMAYANPMVKGGY